MTRTTRAQREGVIAATTTAPPRPCSRRGRIPRARRARNGHSTALFAAECQSFLDNLLLVLGATGHGMIPTAFPPWQVGGLHQARAAYQTRMPAA
jgi:hypothetical protein